MARNRFQAIDTVLVHQALITGQVTDGLTGRPTAFPATVELYYQVPAGQPEKRFPMTARIGAGGLFVFAADPATAFPRLAPGESLKLKLAAGAPGYQAQSIEFTLTDADLAVEERTIVVDGETLSVPVLGVPLREQNVALLPEPVHLAGQVVRADDPVTALPTAQVRITQPEARGPVASDSLGFFILTNLPVALEVTVQVAAFAGFQELETTVHLDFGQPVNQVMLALAPV